MKQSLGIAAVPFLWFLGAPGARVRSLEALVGEALRQSFHMNAAPDQKSFRLSEQEIEYMLGQSREGANGQNRLEVCVCVAMTGLKCYSGYPQPTTNLVQDGSSDTTHLMQIEKNGSYKEL